MRCALLVLAACSSPASREAGPHVMRAETVREGTELLCASAWNGELYGDPFRHWIPDELRAITNDQVVHLIGALTSPDVDRVALFAAFEHENQLAIATCPFRDRLASWPRQLPITPAPR